MRCHPERQWRGITPPPHFRHHQNAVDALPLPVAALAGQQFTVLEREAAASLLMLAGARSGVGKGKKSVLASSSAKKESCSTPASSPTAAATAVLPKCDDHKCSVCARGFATGQALGGHKRCHWEKAYAEMVAVATPSGSCSPLLATSEAAAATTLDLNLPQPGTMPALPWTIDEDGSLNAELDLKLGY
jgi:hypothetical protein